MGEDENMLRVISDYENIVVDQRKRIAALEAALELATAKCVETSNRIEALEAMLQTVVTQERRVAASTDMTRSAMREGAAELADQIDAALKGGGDE